MTGLSGHHLSCDCQRAPDTTQISFVQSTFGKQLYFLSLSIKRISQPMVRLWGQRKRTNIAEFSFGQNTIIGSSATRTLYQKYILRSEYVLRRPGRCHQKLRKRSGESWLQSSGSRSTLHHNQAYTSQSTTGGKAT